VLKFSVKNLGRVASADVELAPLTILVGKNNTGKSYLATLIWALGRPALLTEVGAFRRKPAWFADLVTPLKGKEPNRVTLDAAAIKHTVATIERAFNRKAAELLSRVFAVEGFQSTKVTLSAALKGPITFTLAPYKARVPTEGAESEISFSVTIGETESLLYIIQEEWLNRSQSWLSDLFFQDVIGYCLFGPAWKAYRNQTYIPAARTGIMLALPALVSQSLGAPKREAVGLPRPLSAFLSRMTERSNTRRNRPAPIRDRLKAELLRGQISVPREAVSDFRYTPEGLDVELPLYATSSMITELAPFMVALENDPGTHHFIFEEPEAHLHLEAQREMARIIARLVAAGTPVTLTTHSDTLLQQINNLIVLSDHPQRDEKMAELGYDANDLITRASVEAYEFCPVDSGTIVRRVEKTADGFVVATLNETLIALAQETLSLRSGRDG
jgi:hypothetical protein